MSSSTTKRPASFSYGRPGQIALLTPDPSPSYFATTADAESQPSPLLLPTASLPPTPAPAAPAPKSKSKAASAKSQRKINHSIIEKRRREKINGCLAELRDLVPAESSDGSGENDSKGEFKLEILVRTVDYVKELQRKIRRLELAQQTLSSGSVTSPARARSSARSGDQSPWQGIETESEGGLSPGASDMSIDEAGEQQTPPPPMPLPAPMSASLPTQAQLYGSPAGPFHRQSAPAFVPIGFQRLPSISSMLPPSTTNGPGSGASGHHPPSLPPTQPHLSRAHSSFSSFGNLPGAQANYHLPPQTQVDHLHRQEQQQQHHALAQGGKDELRAAELLLAISSPELRGLAGADDEIEDWSLGSRLLGGAS